MATTEFGLLPDGEPVQEVRLRSGRMEAKVISWGAVLRDLRMELPGGRRPLVLGFEQLSHYLDHSRNHGANVGRYGGRTRGGRLLIGDRSYSLSRNLDGRHHLHGGFCGLGRRNWRLLDATEDAVMLEIRSPDGDEGYPGELTLTCRYRLSGNGFSVELEAITSAPTPINVLHHSYFNLDGAGQIAGHALQIHAQEYLEFDSEGLPTGRKLPVRGSFFDFIAPRVLGHDERFDTSFVISSAAQSTLIHAASLVSGMRDLRMDVRTTEPGLHFYNGFAAAAPVPGLDGRPHLPCSGLCLEATRFNDAVNMPRLGDVILHPGQTYRQKTEFDFEPQQSSAFVV